jgi:hypothetical protein
MSDYFFGKQTLAMMPIVIEAIIEIVFLNATSPPLK